MRDLLVDDLFARGEETDHLGPKADPRVPITNFLHQAFVKERSVVPPSPWLSGLLVSMTSQSVVFGGKRKHDKYIIHQNLFHKQLRSSVAKIGQNSVPQEAYFLSRSRTSGYDYAIIEGNHASPRSVIQYQ